MEEEAEYFLPAAAGEAAAGAGVVEVGSLEAADFPVAEAAPAAAAQEGAGNMHPREFKKYLQHDGIVTAIREAEEKTSGQIRVDRKSVV